MVCLAIPYDFTFFKGCLPQVLRHPFLNTLTHLIVETLDLNVLKLRLTLIQKTLL